jgi:uncharacterized membrane protein
MVIKLDRWIESAGSASALEGPADVVRRVGRGLPARLAERGQAVLGHPVHPAMTDLPIGFWTSAWALDLLPSRDRTAAAARTLLGLGVLSTGPAVLTGLGDAAGMSSAKRRQAALHAALNVGATAAFACSWWLRRGQTSTRARAVAHLGAALATAAAAVGGHLAFPPDDETDAESADNTAGTTGDRHSGAASAWAN